MKKIFILRIIQSLMQCQITVFFPNLRRFVLSIFQFFCYLLESHSAHKQIFFILFQFLSTCLFTELVFTPHVWLIHSFFYVQVDYIQSHSFHLPLDKLAERAKIALCQICDVSSCYWLKSLIHIHQNQRIFSKPRCLSKVKTCRCCS